MSEAPSFRYTLDQPVCWSEKPDDRFTIEECRYTTDGNEYMLADADGILTSWVAEHELAPDDELPF